MNSGVVALIGRTNSGKSTLLNNLIGQKVAITSTKPQTTRFPISAVYEDERGQIIFIDTPGIFAKSPNLFAKKVGEQPLEVLKGKIDLVIYLVDHTRYRDSEENKTLGLVRKIDNNIPRILVFNKWDIQKPSYYPQYRFLEDEFHQTIKVSALKRKNLGELIKAIYFYLPEHEKKLLDVEGRASPLLNIDSKTFLEEIIREKAFKSLGEELPYTLTVKLNELTEREDGTLYLQADILTTNNKYKAMIVGKKGQKIKEIGMSARKEIELARNKKIFLDLKVKVDPDWMQCYF